MAPRGQSPREQQAPSQHPCLGQLDPQAPKAPMGTSYLNSFSRKHSILYSLLVAKQEESSLCPTGKKSTE